MASLKTWVEMGRPHTAALTIPFALLGLVAAGRDAPASYVLLGLWTLAFHYFGFVHNNLHDLAHDRADPSKQHFPLVSGAIQVRTGWQVWAVGTVLLWLAGLGASLAPGAHLLGSLVSLHVALVLGLGYNVASKRWRGAPFLISASFAALAAFAYFAAGGAPDTRTWPIALYIVAYGFALMLHEIAYGGYLKDLAPDPVNWLRAWGARAERVDADPAGDVYEYRFPPLVQAWAWVSRLLCVALALGWVLLVWGYGPLQLGLVGLFTVLLLAVFARLASPGRWPRQRKLGLLAGSEILAYFLLLASLHPLLGWLAPAWYLAPLVWFVAWNFIFWGRALAPKV